MRAEAAKLLTDRLTAARGVTSLVQGRTIEQYRNDLQLRRAVERGLEIVGEALARLRKIEPAVAESFTDYRAIIGSRNVLIHGYSAINSDKVGYRGQRVADADY